MLSPKTNLDAAFAPDRGRASPAPDKGTGAKLLTGIPAWQRLAAVMTADSRYGQRANRCPGYLEGFVRCRAQAQEALPIRPRAAISTDRRACSAAGPLRSPARHRPQWSARSAAAAGSGGTR